MIFFQIFIFVVSIVLLSFSISGYGKLINSKIKNNFFLDIFLGFIVISFIITTLHFFLNINLIISFSILTFGLILFFYKKNLYFSELLKKKNIFSLVVFFIFIPMFLSQKYHEDFGYYHLPYALGFLEEKIVFGYANIDKSYVYNSIWLNLYSIFFLYDKNFDFLTVPSYLLFLAFILFSVNQIITNKKKSISDYYLITILFYFILKFTRISEFGVDLPSIIFSILGIYYFMKFSEINSIKEKKEYFFLTIIFSIFAILIKLSTLPIIILPLYIFFKNYKYLKFSILNFKYFFVILLFTTYFIQQFIYTGCFIFPTNLTCFEVSWFNSEYLKLSKELELVNKSYFQEAKKTYSPEQYLNNFNWLYFWIKRNFIEILEHFLTIIIPSLLFLFFLKKENKINNMFKEKVALYILLFASLIFWLNFSPVYRFAIHLFATLTFIIISGIFLYKKFSKKVFIIFVAIFVSFSFSKNIIRLNSVESIYLGIQKINNKYVLNKSITNEFAKVFYPDVKNNFKNGWQGRLCWNTPFICSYNKLEVSKKNGYLIINKLKN
jgi:hypothetical protein